MIGNVGREQSPTCANKSLIVTCYYASSESQSDIIYRNYLESSMLPIYLMSVIHAKLIVHLLLHLCSMFNTYKLLAS